MSLLKNAAAKFDAFAAEVIADALAEVAKVAGQVVDTVVETTQEVADDIAKGDMSKAVHDLKDGGGKILVEFEGGFLELVDEFGKDATKFVHDLMNDVSIPGGNEKANLAATSLVDAAAAKGLTIAAQDVTTLIKNSFLAVKDQLSKL